jgi:hypothetical protein
MQFLSKFTRYTGNPGEPYNQGVGLGIPDLTKLAGDLG